MLKMQKAEFEKVEKEQDAQDAQAEQAEQAEQAAQDAQDALAAQAAQDAQDELEEQEEEELRQHYFDGLEELKFIVDQMYCFSNEISDMQDIDMRCINNADKTFLYSFMMQTLEGIRFFFYDEFYMKYVNDALFVLKLRIVVDEIYICGYIEYHLQELSMEDNIPYLEDHESHLRRFFTTLLDLDNKLILHSFTD